MTPTERSPAGVQNLRNAERRDAADALAGFRAAFDLPDGLIYLDGNSLGPPPRRALDALARAANDEWRRGLIRSWNGNEGRGGWIDLPARAGAKIAALIGADADDVVVADSVSVNLFKLAAALLADGAAISIDADEFPTDQYVLEGLARLAGRELVRLAPGDSLRERNIGVMVRSLVHYKSAAIADMAATERDAADAGASVIWDLSHATGLLKVDVKRAGARFAVGCGYKYLNGGPGAPAFLYCARDDAARLRQPISGWMGHAAPFRFAQEYAPAEGARRFLAGTPPILSMTALDAALDLFDGLDMTLLEAKARALGDLFLARAEALGFKSASPTTGRGGHVALSHPEGYRIVQALIAEGVIGDFRAPDLMRFGFSPLFLSFAEVWRATEILRDVMESGRWREPQFAARATVT